MTSYCVSAYKNPCYGRIEIKTYDLSDNLLYEYKSPNVIVNGARDTLARLLMGEATDVNNKKISTIKMGTNNTAPDRTQTALSDTSSVLSLAVSSTLVSGKPGEVKFTATMDSAVGNEVSYKEVGLFSADNTMFARQIHPTQSKTSDVKLEYTWIIAFT